MSFGLLQPWVLAGLAAIALPVIAHLLNKRKHDTVDWGAMQFLQPGQKTRRRLQLEELLLLALRIAVIAILVLAFARPWGKGGLFQSLSKGSRRDVAYVIDGSYSLGRIDLPRSPQTEARQWVQKALQLTGPGDTVTIWDAREQATRIVPPELQNLTLVREELDRVAPPAGGSKLPPVMVKAIQDLSSGTNPIRDLIVVTDNQAAPWMAHDAPLWARVNDLCEQQSIKPRLWGVQVIPPETPTPTNLMVNRLVLSRSVTVPGFPVRIRSTVRQFNGSPARRPVSLSINGQRLQDQTTVINLPADGEVPVEFEHRLETPGTYLISVSVDPDALPGDDASYSVLTVASAVPVLLVDGKPSLDPVRSQSFFVNAALTGADQDSSWVRPTTVPASGLTAQRLEGQDVVVLLDVEELSDAQIGILTRFVQAGGGLVIAPGEHARPDFYKKLGSPGPNRLLPANLFAIKKVEADSGQSLALDGASLEARWLQRFRPGQGLDLTTTSFSTYWELQQTGTGTEPAASNANAPARDEPVIAAKFKNGAPWIVTQRFGSGQVALLATPLDASWSTLPTRNDFVPLVHELLFSLVSRGQGRVVETGASLEFPVTGESVASDYQFQLPDGQVVTATPGSQGDRPTARLNRALQPGVYEARHIRRPNDSPEYFVAEFDRTESDLTPLSPESRDALQSNQNIRWITSLDEWRDVVLDDSPRSEIWWLILGGVLVLLVIEIGMTRRLVNQGRGTTIPSDQS